jgi:hypothetical protein
LSLLGQSEVSVRYRRANNGLQTVCGEFPQRRPISNPPHSQDA